MYLPISFPICLVSLPGCLSPWLRPTVPVSHLEKKQIEILTFWEDQLLLTLSGQSGSGPRFHSSRSLAPSSLFTAAHSGDTFAAVSLGGSCCFLGFFRGLGSRLLGAGGGAPAPASSTISEEIAEIVEDPEDSGLGGESWSSALPWMLAGGSPSGLFLRMEGLGEPGTSRSGSEGCWF